eukprot:9496066-Prorocentrum_lima.AAC.1
MTSSLVGSEMCIRDRPWARRRLRAAVPMAGSPHPLTKWQQQPQTPPPRAVSYTHLTLPTICSV